MWKWKWNKQGCVESLNDSRKSVNYSEKCLNTFKKLKASISLAIEKYFKHILRSLKAIKNF